MLTVETLFDGPGAVLAVIATVGALPDGFAATGVLEQDGLAAARANGLCVPIGAAAAHRNQPARGRAAQVDAGDGGQRYLLALTGDDLSMLAPGGAVALVWRDSSGRSHRQALGLSRLSLDNLRDEGFRLALADILDGLNHPRLAEILRLPFKVESPDSRGWGIDRAVTANGALVVQGWMPIHSGETLHLVTDDLRCWAFHKTIAIHDRPTVLQGHAADQPDPEAAPRSNCTAVLSGLRQPPEQVYAVTVSASGEAAFHGPARIAPQQDAQAALALVGEAYGPIQSLPFELIRPVYRPLLSLPATRAQARRFEFGPKPDPDAPLCSVVIPFYGDAFFLNCVYHLQRVLGGGFEVILVVDDPDIWAEVYGRLSARSTTIRLPTVVLQCERNYGYAQANNLGFLAARGDVIVLMNSDIMITDPAALVGAAETIRARKRTGNPEIVVGFSLLYEDDTVQHVGLEFPRSAIMGNLHIAEHPMKGMPVALYDGARDLRVDGTTGALMALSSDLYRALGGFDTAYVRGDFEDADLCLRARQAGAEIRVHVRPGLYHLERQSIRRMENPAFREMITYLNCVEFNRRWGAHLSELALRPPQQHKGEDSRPGVVRVRKRQAVHAPDEHPRCPSPEPK